MTLFSMCSRVMAVCGWPIPSSIAANNDATAQQIFALANSELQAISQKYDWPHLEVEYTFDTVVDQETYLWPAATFRKVVDGSVYDADHYNRVRGSSNIEQWNRLKYGLLSTVSHQHFRQCYSTSGAPALKLAPTPTDVRSLVALYITKEYARDTGGTSKALYVADTDESKVPEYLVELGLMWRFRRAKGLDYSAELAEYNETVPHQFANYKALGDIIIGADPYAVDVLTSGYVPDTGFG